MFSAWWINLLAFSLCPLTYAQFELLQLLSVAQGKVKYWLVICRVMINVWGSRIDPYSVSD